jgi:hypothetical protein
MPLAQRDPQRPSIEGDRVGATLQRHPADQLEPRPQVEHEHRLPDRVGDVEEVRAVGGEPCRPDAGRDAPEPPPRRRVIDVQRPRARVQDRERATVVDERGRARRRGGRRLPGGAPGEGQQGHGEDGTAHASMIAAPRRAAGA